MPSNSTYKITYYLTGGIGNIPPQTKQSGTDIVLSSVIPRRTGYNFGGWSTTVGGTVAYDPGDVYSSDADLSLYAVWEEDQMYIINRHNKYINSLKHTGMKAISMQWLNPDGSVAFDITEDAINNGTINVSNATGARRTASISMDNWSNLYDVNVDKIWFGQQIKLYVGAYDEDGNKNMLPNGVFYISDPSIVNNPGNKVSNLNLVDKWAFLDGSLGGNLEGVYIIAIGADLRSGIVDLLSTDRGNGYPIDSVYPIFDNTISPSVIMCPYEYRSSDTGTLANVLTEIGTMMICNIGYDENGRLRVDNAQLDVDNKHLPVLWDFTEDDIILNGLSTKAAMTKVYNDIIVTGGVLSGALVQGRATNTSPSSPSSVYRIGYKTKKYNESKYYSNTQCTELAEYYLNESKRIQFERSFTCSPLYHLKPNNLISIRQEYGGVPEYYLINNLTIPLAQNGNMTINATSISVFE